MAIIGIASHVALTADGQVLVGEPARRQAAANDAGISHKDVDRVVLVGGPTRILDFGGDTHSKGSFITAEVIPFAARISRLNNSFPWSGWPAAEKKPFT